MSQWYRYLLLYALGITVAYLSPTERMIEALNILGPITLTALFASLLVPFAGLSANEKVQKFCLQYAIVPLFGLYTVLLWHKANVGGIVLFFSAAGVHVSYWTTGYHSRQYRLEQFRTLASAASLRYLPVLVSLLNGRNLSHVADGAIIAPILQSREIDLEKVKSLLHIQEELACCLVAEAKRIGSNST